MHSAARAAYDRGASTYNRSISLWTACRLYSVDEPQRRLAGGAASAPGHVVLELGAGTGRLLQRLPPGSLGVDVSLGMLRSAVRRGLPVVAAAGESLPLRDSSVAVVVSGNGSLRYMDRSSVFSELFRVLEPGGRFAFHLYARRPWTLGGWLRGKSLDLGPPNLDSTAELERELRCHGLYLERVVATLDLPGAPWVVSLRGLPGPLGPHVTFIGRCAQDKEREGARSALRRRIRGGERIEMGVVGRSMAPALDIGDRIAVTPGAPVALGDLVVIDGFDEFVVHRLIARVPTPGGSWFVHRGLRGSLGWAREGQLLGKAEVISRLNDRLALTVRQGDGEGTLRPVVDPSP